MNDYESSRRLLLNGVASAKAKEVGIARRLLERVLDLPSTPDMQEKAHYWLAVISDDEREKREHLEEVLAYNSANYQARRMLAVLDGRLDEGEIVNADRLPEQNHDTRQVGADRFTCPKCGARMVFSPDGLSLVCEHCDREEAISNHHIVEEQDFVVGMAEAKGHQKAMAMQSFRCSGCGAVYLLAPETITLTCPHCDSVYTILQADTREVIPPEGIIPFSLTQEQAQARAVEWLKQQGIKQGFRLAPFKGLYSPVWTFDFGGTIEWNCRVYNSQLEDWVSKEGTELAYVDDLLVDARKSLPRLFEVLLGHYDTKGAAPFDTGYTANFLAETYQVTMSDAALQARSQVLQQIRPKIEDDIIEKFDQLQLSSLGLIIESYKLLLVPVWLSGYSYENTDYPLLVNGQSGDVVGGLPPTRMQKLKRWLME